MPPSLIIFDFDGTLADTRYNIVSTLQAVMHNRAFPTRSDDDCATTIGLPLKEAFLRLQPQLSDADADACTAEYRILFEESRRQYIPQPFPQVVETLDQMKHRHIRLSVATSRSFISLTPLLNDMQLADYFELVVGAESVSQAKPSPMPVLHTLGQLQVSPDQALVVGDMPVDILMGRNAGVKTCGVTYGNGTPADLLAAGADYLVDNFADLLHLTE